MGDHVHHWGPIERAPFTGNPHRRCLYCLVITLDLADEEESDDDRIERTPEDHANFTRDLHRIHLNRQEHSTTNWRDKTITIEHLLRIAAALLSEDGENAEYDRALAEVCTEAAGFTMDASDRIAFELRGRK